MLEKKIPISYTTTLGSLNILAKKIENRKGIVSLSEKESLVEIKDLLKKCLS